MSLQFGQDVRRSRLLFELNKRLCRERYEEDFLSFVEAAWPSIDPSEYKSCWAIDALCEHLQAVADGEISRLLVNFPPRCGKTNVTSICFPAWVWARSHLSFRSGPQVRFLCGSYNHDLALGNSNMSRRLIMSRWYQSLWGSRFFLQSDQNTKTKFDTSKGGSRYSTSVSGSLLGIGGDVILVDDPHNTESVESESERANVLRWWKEISGTRLNDPKQSALIVIMQRLHQEDVSGIILGGDSSSEWVHLCIPMEYDWPRHCVTSIGWQDPRGLDDEDDPLVLIDDAGLRYPRDAEAQLILDTEREGELMWKERFGEREVSLMKMELGPYMASGRLQQIPTPKEGGIFRKEWWGLWEPADGKFPTFELIVASLDGAFTEDEENDPSALSVWGTFVHPETKKHSIMLIFAWRKHLAFSAERCERLAIETMIDGKHWLPEVVVPGMIEDEVKRRNARFRRRTMNKWGLVEHAQDTCSLYKADLLLIENKASGRPAAQEIANRYGLQRFSIQMCEPKGDKVARALSVQPIFAQGLVYAPEREWSAMVLDEMEVFPKGSRDDLTDTATQAMKYFRDNGLARTDEEVSNEEYERVRHKPQQKALYPV